MLYDLCLYSKAAAFRTNGVTVQASFHTPKGAVQKENSVNLYYFCECGRGRRRGVLKSLIKVFEEEEEFSDL